MSKMTYFKPIYHFKCVPKFMQDFMAKTFMKHRNEIVDVFNKHIDEVNHQWDLTGKPATFGDFEEDLNPEYCEFLRDEIQPFIDEVNKRFVFCRYKLGKYGEIDGYIPFIKNSKIWVIFKKIEV